MSNATENSMKRHLPATNESAAKRWAALCFGAVAYFIFLATFLYAIGFVSQYAVPKSINTGPTSPVVQACLVDLALMSLFAIQHSGMARQSFKRLLARIVSTAVERSIYVLLSSLSLALLFWQWQPIVTVLWTIETPALANLVTAVGFFGWLIVVLSTYLISHFELFGLTQVAAYFAGRAAPTAEFKAPGLYRLIRHPIYLGFIIAFWSTPTMTVGQLLFATVTTIYILVGIQLEERDLMTLLGDEYRRYRNKVPMLLPTRGLTRDN
jgi:protein-S-isoprenylcysteine O-methyltransferase Ste14